MGSLRTQVVPCSRVRSKCLDTIAQSSTERNSLSNVLIILPKGYRADVSRARLNSKRNSDLYVANNKEERRDR